MRKSQWIIRGKLARGFFCALFLMNILWGAVFVEAAGSGMSGTRTAQEHKPGLELYATSAVLMDADSCRVLYEKDGYSPMAMASTTKIMTCILVLENGDLDDVAQVSSYAASMPKVKLYAKRGEEYRVRSLLFSLMLESHNDSAVILAEYIGKKYLPEELAQKETSAFNAEESRQAVKMFAGLMNEKAAELGCENTYFITPNGLDATEEIEGADGGLVQREHCTTAAELARIMAYCINESPRRDVFREITRTDSYSFCENGRNVTCVNHNAFLNMMDGAFSGKTGFTNKAGYCYVGALEREGKTFIVALLACGWPNNKSYKWSDTRKLMEYGLENYDFREFLGEDAAYDESKLKALAVEDGQTKVLGGTARVPVEIRERHDEGQSQKNSQKGLLMRQDEEIQVDCEMEKKLQAPVRENTQVGSILYSVDGKVYLTETIVTGENVERIEFPWCIEQIFRRFLVC